MARSKRDDSDDNDDLTHVTGMADRLKLKGKPRQDYIHKHMVGLGFKPRVTYDPPGAGDDDDDEDDGSGFF